MGTEYVVAQAHPPSLFVIHKRERTSPSEGEPVLSCSPTQTPCDAGILQFTPVTTTGMYYVLNDNIYQSPSLYTVINERIVSTNRSAADTPTATDILSRGLAQLTSLHALSSSLSLIKERKPHWTPESLYQWDIKPPPASALSSAGPDEVVSEHDNHKKGTADLKRSAGDIDEIDSIGLAAGTAAVDDGASDDDDDPPRPASAFNPLLFRALQTVASSLPDPPPAPVEPTRPNAVRFGTNDQLDGEDKKPATSSVPSASTGDKGAGPAQHHEAVQDSKRIKLVSTGKR